MCHKLCFDSSNLSLHVQFAFIFYCIMFNNILHAYSYLCFNLNFFFLYYNFNPIVYQHHVVFTSSMKRGVVGNNVHMMIMFNTISTNAFGYLFRWKSFSCLFWFWLFFSEKKKIKTKIIGIFIHFPKLTIWAKICHLWLT